MSVSNPVDAGSSRLGTCCYARTVPTRLSVQFCPVSDAKMDTCPVSEPKRAGLFSVLLRNLRDIT